MSSVSRFFTSIWGIIFTGLVIGILAPVLVNLGNPGNMGICVVCFTRDIAGALGFHRAAVVQYIRPEIIGLMLGALVAALVFREFKPRTGSSPLIRFLLGMFAVFGALLFLMIARFFSESFENNVFTQISLVMLIAMAAKNAILIVEFAKIKFDEGLSLFDAAIESARLRFRPILMTAFSFILGVFPLVVASGAGAEARKVMGMALLGGMTMATLLGVFFYPMLFVLIGKLGRYEQKREKLQQLNPKS